MNNRLTAEEIFHAARDKSDPAERAGFLDGACGNDVSVRAMVDALLNADAEAGEFLRDAEEAPRSSRPSSPTRDATPRDQAGEMIGRYKLLQQIGEGGFGVVYMAEQREPVKRRVALKIIKLGMDTRQVIARFEAERQALAMMDHPHIAKVLDAGSTETGRLYFVMEYIKGVPILEYCDTEKLDTRQRLELFTKVCQAIQHAHQKGIIHRDIKPSNVLITLHDGVPVPKVIDFGIAKATNAELTARTLFTEHRQMIGTPAYMSPEQAEMSGLDIDTRSDIYSLGVLLYELLTGTTPFDSKELMSKGFAEMMRIIREVEPRRPSTRLSSLGETGTRTAQQRRAVGPKKLSQTFKGDLDWIVMKCLEKDRTRRYETANGLAMDIKRHLNDEPVTAGPPGAMYKLRKFVRRHKWPLAANAAAATLTLAGLIGTSTGMVWALNEKNKATLAADSETKAKRDADQKREEAERNLEYARKGNEILGSVFENLDPRQNYETVAELRNALKANLAEAIQDLESSAIGDPLVVAEMQTTLGGSLLGLGAADQAIPLLSKARETRLERLGPDHPDTLFSMNELASAYWETGNLELALPMAEETLKRRRNLLGPDHPDTLRSMNNLAGIYWKAGQLDVSIPLFEELVKRQEAILGPNDRATLLAMGNLGVNYRDANRMAEAMPLLEETLTRFKATLGPDHPDTLIAMTNLAQGYQKGGRLDLAVPLYEETIERASARLGPEHPHTIKTKNSLAYAYWLTGQFDKSVPLYEENLQRLDAKLGPDHPETLAAAANLSGNYLGAGRFEAAIPLLEKTLSLAKADLGPDHQTTVLTMNNLGGAYLQSGRPDESIPLYEEILKLYEAKNGKDDLNTLQTATSLGIAYRNAGQLESAIPLLEEALRVAKATLGPNHPATLRCMDNLARAHQVANKLDLALPLFEEALELEESTLGSDHPATLGTMNNLAVALRSANQLDSAIPLFEQVLTLREAKLGRDHPDTLAAAGELGVSYQDAGRTEEAIPLLEEAHQAAGKYPQLRAYGPNLLDAYVKAADPAKPDGTSRATALVQELLADARATLPEDSPELAGQLAHLSLTLLGLKAWDEAEPLIREALAIREANAPDDWRTFNTRSMLGEVLMGQTKLTEAEPLLLEGYRGMKEREAAIPPRGKARITDALERLVQFYEATRNEAEAAAWRSRLEAARAEQTNATASGGRR